MKLAIIGSRKFDDYAQLLTNIPEGVTEVVSGGAAGADTLAERFADEHELPKKIFLPKFKSDPSVGYHPGHFHQRNKQIAEYADTVLAFMPHGGSKGTQSTINYAKKAGTPCQVVHF